MTGPAAAALTLSLAVAVLPSSPRARLAPGSPPDRQSCRRWAGWTAGCAAAVAAVLLPLTTALATAVVGATVALRYRRHRHGRLGVDESRSLEAALDVLVGELRTGAHPVQAFSVAAAETGGIVADRFHTVAARARLGADVAAGLRSAARSSAMPAHWDRLAVCWQLAAEHGLAMSALMRAAQRDIAERHRFSAQVRARMAGARATAAILAGLPVLGVLLGQLIGAQPLRFLLGGHAGGWLLVVGTMLVCGGLLWSDRITDRVAS
ncbi:type II secretion system F family protein [Mycobacterium xenopi]|uniref:type II secretion system F family protein n=1 Tax=Mycobacterium xenopi TaxID=1789 RepID=UPI000586AFFE|nr:type II secretion system F family protein [Mycobacterium xenopi]